MVGPQFISLSLGYEECLPGVWSISGDKISAKLLNLIPDDLRQRGWKDKRNLHLSEIYSVSEIKINQWIIL